MRPLASPPTPMLRMAIACSLLLACESGGSDDGSGSGGHAGDDPSAATGGHSATGTAGVVSGGATTVSGGAPATGGAPVEVIGTIDCRTDGDGATTLTFVNRCQPPITIQGSDVEAQTVTSGAFVCVTIGSDVEPLSSRRYWGWVGADPGSEHHTLAEFTFNTDFNDFDWYDISHVDGHNLPMQVVPVARPDCPTLTCAESWLTSCPEEGRYTDASGAVVACVSPDRDDAESPVVLFFEACDDAYAWSGDDQYGEDPSPMAACAGEDWDIVFCPEAEE